MFEISISKDSHRLLCMIYEEYLLKRDTMSKDLANMFPEAPDFVYEHFSESDCYSCLDELKSNDLITLYIDGSFELTNNAIIYMENRFKKGISEIVDFLSKLI